MLEPTSRDFKKLFCIKHISISVGDRHWIHSSVLSSCLAKKGHLYMCQNRSEGKKKALFK